MDRFFVAYDRACKKKGYFVDWFFAGGEKFEYYEDLNIHFSDYAAVENYFIEFSSKNNLKYDVLVTHFVELCTSFFKRIKYDGKPYIISVDHNPRPIRGFPLKKKLKNKLKGRLYSRYIDCFVGVSNYTRDQILKDYGHGLSSKTEVIYNGIDTDVYYKRSEENFGKFIVASHLRPSKGIQDLIEAVSILPQEIKTLLKIDIFGEGPMEQELKEMVKYKNLNDQFNFKGSSPDLPDVFQNYSYMLQPTYMECFSLSILESLASNVPVITTPVGGNTEVIVDGQNGFIFEAGNVKELSKIIKAILQEKKTISNSVRKIVEENYYLEKMVCDHVGLLNL